MQQAEQDMSMDQPTLTVIVEGYNETRELGEVDDTVEALMAQDYPLNRIEVILCGTHQQVKNWRERYAKTPFHDVKVVGMDTPHYYALKNAGLDVAAGRIIAITDSDVQPVRGWASAIVGAIDAGADASAGASAFNKRKGIKMGSGHPLMRACASQTWGWVLGAIGPDGVPAAKGFMDHNIAIRADVMQQHRYRTDFGRVLSSGFLFRDLVENGHKVVITPGQEAAHVFYWSYWLIRLHVRYGYETYAMRREDPRYPNQWIRKTGPFEPLVSMVWHMMLDVPRWFRYSRVVGMGPVARAAVFPLALCTSLLSRGCEFIGTAASIIAPKKTRNWAENV
jgi:glycosyltransferase involved in cell wall biosynthesis